MALRLFSQSPNVPSLDYTADASIGYTLGNVAYRDTSSGEIKEETGGAATSLTVECVINKTETSAASNPTIRAIPIISGAGQLWVADCNATTAANQLNKAHDMTDAGTVDNTSTTDTTTAGIFIALKIIGATGDKKLLGYFIKLGQVTT